MSEDQRVPDAHLRSVNVGQPEDGEWAGSLKRSSHRKHSVSGPVLAHRLGLAGDQVTDIENHGGPDMAVYAFAREDLDRWAAELGHEIPDGHFGENLTTYGIDVNEALVGERWRIGEALFEVAKVRIPCTTFKEWMGETGVDNARWVRRFTADARPGPYLRVLAEGLVAAGDPIEVVHRPAHGLTVSFMFRALTTERHLASELLRVDGLAASVRETVGRHVGA
jgi:MOSC domain-containing protein YiiM